MTREVVNTSSWTMEQIAPYGREITAALKKVVDRFPKDVSLDQLREDMFSGAQQLWIMLDDGKFEAAALTEIRVSRATGNKSVIITNLGGDGGEDMVPWIEKIEAWAREQGAHDVRATGRLGWRKALKKAGYDVVTVYYRKDL